MYICAYMYTYTYIYIWRYHLAQRSAHVIIRRGTPKIERTTSGRQKRTAAEGQLPDGALLCADD